jgi:putative ABC transport system permease protein
MSASPRFSFFGLVQRNLKSRPYRNAAVILAFALIAATLFSAQYLAGGAAESLNRGTRWIQADLVIIPGDQMTAGENTLLAGKPAMFFFSDTGFEKISRIPGIARASPQILLATLSNASCCSDYLQIIAVDPERDFTLSPWLGDHPGVTLGRDSIIIGSGIQGDVGSDLIFYGHTFHIAGRLDPTGMRGVDKAVFIRMEDAYAMAGESGSKAEKTLTLSPGMVSSVLVQLDPGVSPAAVSDAVSREIPGVRIITADHLSGIVSLHLAGITLFLREAAIGVTAVFLPVLILVSIMLAREMKQEITLLGALGATRTFVLRLIVAETFAASVIGSFAGIGAALVVLVAFQDLIALSLGIPFIIPPLFDLVVAAASTLILALAISGIASMYPTIRLLRSDAYGNIRSEAE